MAAAAGEYFYFIQKIDAQHKQIFILTAQNNSLKTKINKRTATSSFSIKYVDLEYKNGYTIENSCIYLSPLDDSPIVYKCTKAVKVSVLYAAEVSNIKWYEISITINSTLVKGWIKDSDIKLMVEETYNKSY
jgi:hypothetical protein